VTRLLRDLTAEERFRRDGFVVVRLLSYERVEALLSLYNLYIGGNEITGLYESSRNKPYEINRVINDAIQEQISGAAKDIFLASTIYGGTFMVKSHIDSEVLPLHQDWSVVEEEQNETLFVWCPLVDVSILNGGIFALPGSHKWFRSIRSGSYPSNRYPLPTQLQEFVVDMPLRAGEAFLYSDALFHGSHANNGSQDRIVVTARVVEEGAQLVYFHKHSETEVEVYEASPEFYLRHIDGLAKGLMPAGVPRLYRRPYSHEPVTSAALETAICRHCIHRPDAPQPKQLFKDPGLQSEFDRNGFVVIDLIEQLHIDELQEFYAGLQNAPTPEGGFQVSLDNPDPNFVRGISERIMAAAGPSVDQHFRDYQIFTASFVTKGKNPRGVVPPHQDWTFVDESRFWSATIWCPLVNVASDNGALALLKGSHLLYDHVRPSPSPQYAPPFKDQLFTIFPYMQIVALRAGQAVVFNNQTLHASPPNTTNQTRVAFGVGITHRDAQLRHYYLLPEQSEPLLEGYEVSPSFFFSYNNARLSALQQRGERPKGLNSIGVFAMRCKQYDATALAEKMSAAGNRADHALWQQLVGAFGEEYSRPARTASTEVRMGQSLSTPADTRPLWKVYTPANILKEIRYRLTKS
jgi:ectoine hydroxylase-related dioxygenase (phytanoyl-CoA dioxygenase family)